MPPSQFSIFALLLFSLSLSLLASSERCHPNDKTALLQIKKDLRNPTPLLSWIPLTDCCDWDVVRCHQKTNRITVFDLLATDIHLPIPAAIGDLPYLLRLSFHDTNITGQIPSFLSKLTRLNLLDLGFNQLTGPIPPFLGHLRKLTYLRLSFNHLIGSIPPSLSRLPELQNLLLDHNKLTGGIPASFADFKQHDFYLYLNHNHLSGPIPARLGSTNFSEVYVSENRLEGDISFLFGKNKNLSVGDFSVNQFEFDLSNIEFSDSLTALFLSHNKVYGRLPENLASTAILFLNVSYNRLCGRIPKLGEFQFFRSDVFVHNKCLCGSPLPECK